MNKKKKIKINKRTYLLAAIACCCVCLFIFKTQADNSTTNFTDQAKQKLDIQKKIDALNEKARSYQQIIDIKRKQQTTLANQISIIETESELLETQIELNKEKIIELNSQVEQLRNQIAEKEESIKGQKIILSRLIQIYYEYDQQGTISFVFGEEGLSRFMSEKDKLTQTGDKISEMIKNVRSLKINLENEKKSIEDKKKEATDLSIDLEEKSSQLESNKAQKQSLIVQTRGEENRYQQLLSRVEEQKQELLGDIDDLYSANSTEINALSSSLAKPTSGLASTSWYYSQKDSRWGNTRIGQSTSLVKDYGCALTSVAMIFTYYGESTTPKNLAQQKIYWRDLIVWPNGNTVDLVQNSSHGGLSWSRIDGELANGNPVIVFIRARGKAGHYVVIHHKVGSDYVVHDPYFGSNIFLSSSIKLLSKLYNTSISKSSVDQMIIYHR